MDINKNLFNLLHKNNIDEFKKILDSSDDIDVNIRDENNNYLGSITLSSLFKNYVSCAAFIQPGSILVLEIDKRNYSLSEIARIVESENKVILSSLLSSNGESDQLEITLKLNSAQIQNLIATFERFGYHIKATFDE